MEKRLIRLEANSEKIYRASLADIQTGAAKGIPPNAVPVGSVEFVVARMKQLKIAIPAYDTYPKCLYRFLGRQLRHCKYGQAKDGLFVKPFARVKLFTGHIKGNWPLGEERPELLDAVDVWESEAIEFLAEQRAYIHEGRILGIGRYDSYETSELPDKSVIEKAVKAYHDAPVAYTLDFGVTKDGRTLLIEANDAWAIGMYMDGDMTIKSYIRVVGDRWHQICGSPI